MNASWTTPTPPKAQYTGRSLQEDLPSPALPDSKEEAMKPPQLCQTEVLSQDEMLVSCPAPH